LKWLSLQTIGYGAGIVALLFIARVDRNPHRTTLFPWERVLVYAAAGGLFLFIVITAARIVASLVAAPVEGRIEAVRGTRQRSLACGKPYSICIPSGDVSLEAWLRPSPLKAPQDEAPALVWYRPGIRTVLVATQTSVYLPSVWPGVRRITPDRGGSGAVA
jgi:hypothetical protein